MTTPRPSRLSHVLELAPIGTERSSRRASTAPSHGSVVSAVRSRALPIGASSKPAVKDKHWDDYREGDGPAFFVAFLQTALQESLTGNLALYQFHVSSRQALVDDHSILLGRPEPAVLPRLSSGQGLIAGVGRIQARHALSADFRRKRRPRARCLASAPSLLGRSRSGWVRRHVSRAAIALDFTEARTGAVHCPVVPRWTTRHQLSTDTAGPVPGTSDPLPGSPDAGVAHAEGSGELGRGQHSVRLGDDDQLRVGEGGPGTWHVRSRATLSASWAPHETTRNDSGHPVANAVAPAVR